MHGSHDKTKRPASAGPLLWFVSNHFAGVVAAGFTVVAAGLTVVTAAFGVVAFGAVVAFAVPPVHAARDAERAHTIAAALMILTNFFIKQFLPKGDTLCIPIDFTFFLCNSYGRIKQIHMVNSHVVL